MDTLVNEQITRSTSPISRCFASSPRISFPADFPRPLGGDNTNWLGFDDWFHRRYLFHEMNEISQLYS